MFLLFPIEQIPEFPYKCNQHDKLRESFIIENNVLNSIWFVLSSLVHHVTQQS